MLVAQQRTHVVTGQQFVEQVDEGNHAKHTGDAANTVDHAVAENGEHHDQPGEQHNADPVFHVQQLCNGLPCQQRAAGREADVHQAHQHQRNHRPIHAKLHATGDHLRQAQLRALRSVQRHDAAAQQLTDQQTDQRPEHITAQHHGQGPGDDRSDLQVGTQPQGELAQ